MLTKELIDKFYEDVDALKLKRPVAAISLKTGFSKGNVSQYLNRKMDPSENFLKKFYTEFYNRSKEEVADLERHVLHDDGGGATYRKSSDVSMQTIFNLSESHKALAIAHEELSQTNKILAESNSRLIDQYATVNALAQMPATSQTRLREILGLLADVGPGKRFFSEEEAWANVIRLWGNLDGKNLKKNIQTGKGTGGR
jgi:CRISPR/Cas system CSM-associated protein Csm2 small subunit